MALVLFDLDQTLISGDSDYLWGEFLSEIGVVDTTEYQQKNQYFFDQYKLGTLNINEYLEFVLTPLAKYSYQQLNTWHKQFMQQKITPILLPKAKAIVDKHKIKNDVVVAITATTDFIAHPIVRAYGIEHLIATEAQKNQNSYTGKIVGVPCFQTGKTIKLKQWLADKDIDLQGSYFYSDSHNDLSLLELVDHPIIVHGDDILLNIAKQRNWQIQSWQ